MPLYIIKNKKILFNILYENFYTFCIYLDFFYIFHSILSIVTIFSFCLSNDLLREAVDLFFASSIK